MSATEQSEPIQVEVRDDPHLKRYDAWVGGDLAGVVYYEVGDGVLTFTHTEVPPAFEGKGVASQLVRGALDDLRARGLGVVPVCPYTVLWIRRHPEYSDLVPEAERHRVER